MTLYDAWLQGLTAFREARRKATFIRGELEITPADADDRTVEIRLKGKKASKIVLTEEDSQFVIHSLNQLYGAEK